MLYEFNVPNTFEPEIHIEPFICAVLFRFLNPLTFNEDNNVVLLFNIVKSLILSEDNIVVNIFKL